ncbi:hypothetical protein N9M10_03400 [Hellea sp.]|nr:hypothetical protein [Hellea sp.]
MRFSKLMMVAALVATTAIAGCRSTKEVLNIGAASEANPGPCPRAFALYDASRIVEFRDGKESYASVGFTGEFQKVRSLCRYYAAFPIEADLDLDISFGRGPAAAEQSTATYEFFVAVTRKNIGVINKKTFPIQVTFPAGADRVTLTERVDEIIIPRAAEGTSGENFEIIVGFELTEAQRNFNAEGKRFRVSAGQQ